MTTNKGQQTAHTTRSASPHTRGDAPQHRGGDAARKAQEWAGGNKASKGPITRSDKQNENSSGKS